MRWTRWRRADERARADGEVVWSRYPDADIKPVEAMISQATVARKPGHRGEHEASRKTIVRGMPVESVFACGDYARVLSPFARETAGATAHPAFPAPSDFFEGRVFLHHSGAKLRRENALVCRGQTLSTHHLAPLKGNGSSVRAVIARSESDEAIQNSPTFDFWIASLRSQ